MQVNTPANLAICSSYSSEIQNLLEYVKRITRLECENVISMSVYKQPSYRSPSLTF